MQNNVNSNLRVPELANKIQDTQRHEQFQIENQFLCKLGPNDCPFDQMPCISFVNPKEYSNVGTKKKREKEKYVY